VLLPGMSIAPQLSPVVGNADYAVSSFVQALQVCLEKRRPEAA